MRTTISLTTFAAAAVLAIATSAQAGGGAYMGGGGGGRGMSGGGGFGGGSMSRGMGASGGAMSAPSAGAHSGGGGGGRHWGGGGNGRHGGDGHWNGRGRHGHGHGHGHWHAGWYYPYWYWPAWGATIAVATTWPYWSGYYVDPYYYPGYTPYAPPTYQYYGPGSGTIIHRDQAPGTTQQPGPQGMPQPYRLYCPATNQFYPDVSECSQQWLKVVPNDGAAPPPTPGARPTPQSLPVYPGSEPRSKEPSASLGTGRYVLARASTTIPAPRTTLPAAYPVAVLVAENATP